MDIDDETLMALADGEITGDAAARLHARIAADPDLAARYALFAQSAHWVKEAALADPEASVSSDLEARVRQLAGTDAPKAEHDKVVPLHREMPRWQPIALAASLALAVGLSTGLVLAPDAPAPDGPILTVDLRDRLGRMPSGAQADLADGRRVTVVASFTDGAGAFCREYEIQGTGTAGFVAVACREGCMGPALCHGDLRGHGRLRPRCLARGARRLLRRDRRIATARLGARATVSRIGLSRCGAIRRPVPARQAV